MYSRLVLLLCLNYGVVVEVLGQNSLGSRLLDLGQHNVFPESVTLSGFSSGGTFAQQLQISYSSLFSGIASFSHAYYRCGPGNGTEADYDNACTIVGNNPVAYDPDRALADIRRYEREGVIERTRNLRNKKLYLYAGSRSSFFNLDQSLGAIRVYEPLIQNIDAIKIRVQDAEQLLPTANFGRACRLNAQNSFFLGNCGFSGAYEALQFLLGDAIKQPPAPLRPNPRNFLRFDQTEFFYGIEGNGDHFMDTIGYIYVPRQCYQRRCFLHLYFHGCLTGREFNGTRHLVNSGYLELAEANDLIVLAPQAVGTGPGGENEIGCWDTYGLTGPNYVATQLGAQVTVVRNILTRILGGDGFQRQNPSQGQSTLNGIGGY
ncbi:Long-chain fatty acid transport protein 6 [Orchesella cincta]|uniref:Long-chain fatty acid transport protein 6 n=1 Tax=Orchesella cincta TaxID=48709 RepID=A0A1D2MMV2_ORCCI|nr:Long-chain fatty acid transport protein 6 [Orchesella cincta]